MPPVILSSLHPSFSSLFSLPPLLSLCVVQDSVDVGVDATVLDRIARIMAYLRLGTASKVRGNSHFLFHLIFPVLCGEGD